MSTEAAAKKAPDVTHYINLLETVLFAPKKDKEALKVANKLWLYQKEYKALAKLLGGKIPWQFIAAIHEMESSASFTKHLHNGDPLKARTVQVPAGRPIAPPANGKAYTWVESACDALKQKGYEKLQSWTLAEMMMRAERYNGLGYWNRGLNSPYVWGGTNHYTKGRFVADGKFDPESVSKRIGCFGVITSLILLERNIRLAMNEEVDELVIG